MSTQLTCVIAEHYKPVVRSLVAIFGCLAVGWGVVDFPIFWKEAAAESVAGRVIAGEPFKAEILARQLSIIDGIETSSAYCRPAAVRSAAIIQLRIVEAATAVNDQEHRDEHLYALSNTIRGSLSCSPADPFLWLVLYWVENTENGSNKNYLKYLQVSYQLGPNEGWIGIKRSRIAFAQFEQLPPDLTRIVMSEFTGLIRSGFDQQAAEIYIGPASRVHNLILSSLKSIPDRDREAFLSALRRIGYDGDQQIIDRQ